MMRQREKGVGVSERQERRRLGQRSEASKGEGQESGVFRKQGGRLGRKSASFDLRKSCLGLTRDPLADSCTLGFSCVWVL